MDCTRLCAPLHTQCILTPETTNRLASLGQDGAYVRWDWRCRPGNCVLLRLCCGCLLCGVVAGQKTGHQGYTWWWDSEREIRETPGSGTVDGAAGIHQVVGQLTQHHRYFRWQDSRRDIRDTPGGGTLDRAPQMLQVRPCCYYCLSSPRQLQTARHAMPDGPSGTVMTAQRSGRSTSSHKHPHKNDAENARVSTPDGARVQT